MKFHKFSWCLPPVVMAGAVAIDVTFLHIPLMSFAALVLIIAVGQNQWSLGSRKTAVLLHVVGFAGFGYSFEAMGRRAGAERSLGRSVANAVRCYTRDTGHRPRRLEDLVPNYLAGPPRTRSPLVGRIRYILVDDKDWCVTWHAGAVCSNIGPKTECSTSSSSAVVPVAQGEAPVATAAAIGAEGVNLP